MALSANAAPTRRERLRAATTQEIIETTRRLLVEQGPDAVSLRAIAREMGMSAPALYRYFDNREELIRHVIADIFTELGRDIRRAIDQVPKAGDDSAKLAVAMLTACREFRRWALAHRGEFALLFGVPLPGIDDGRYDVASTCAVEFAGVFYTLFLELWTKVPFPVPAADEIEPSLLAQIDHYQTTLGSDLPPGAVLIFLRCWMGLYSAVAMEIFGHLAFALTDPAPMFEITLRELAGLVGLQHSPER